MIPLGERTFWVIVSAQRQSRVHLAWCDQATDTYITACGRRITAASYLIVKQAQIGARAICLTCEKYAGPDPGNWRPFA